MPYQTRIFQRAELYEQVWTMPLPNVAERLGVSRIELENTCRRFDIPIPNRDYWAKLVGGLAPERSPLPELVYGRGDIELTRWEDENGEASFIPQVTQALVDAERDPAKRVTVLESLTETHPLVEKAHKAFRKVKPDQTGIVRLPSDVLDVAVTDRTLDRAIRIMDALLKALVSRGLKVNILPHPTVDESHARDVTPGTRVLVRGEWIAFRIVERYSMRKSEPPKPPRGLTAEKLETWRFLNRPRTESVPNGVLTLRILNKNVLGHSLDTRTEWSDGKKPLDACINEFIAHLYLAAEELQRTKVEIAARRQREANEERRRWEAERHAAEERKRDEELVTLVGQWRRARDIREYVEAIRGLVLDAGEQIEAGSELDRHITRALDQACRIDPLAKLGLRKR